MNRVQITITIALLLASTTGLSSKNEVMIDGVAPNGIERLATEIDSHTGAPKNKGHHGLVEYCYKSESFVVYSKNLLGHGYQLSRTKPENLECVVPVRKILSANKQGMFIGMPKRTVESLIGIENLQDKQAVIWLSDTLIDGVVFDVQTYLEMDFRENKLEWISVFTTTTH